ncbi:MAG: AsmA family protein [Acidobacteriaceae bacterium]
MSGKGPRPRWRKTKITLAIFVLLLLALLVPPYISLNAYRRQMTASISRSLGRQVQIQSMHLQLLPTPGIVLDNFTVDSDPAFGAEPALVAPSVVATLRVSSLWRRPIEVSSISMDEPSVNLVRNHQGQWNFSSILLRAAQTPHAPTTQPHPSSTPRFPYIEMDHARINFKQGLVKLPFSFFDADFAIWQQSANQWRVRLAAQPVRTDLDLDLADTGTLRLDGSIGRTTDLDTLPVQLTLSWHDAQLGQASRLLSGQDQGWRGELNMDGSLRGTLQSLALKWKVHIDNPHRIEFTPISSPSLNASCQATYHNAALAVDNLLCLLPTPPGHLLLTGSIPNLEQPKPSLQLEVNHLPAPFLVQIFGLVRQNAGSVSANGVMNGEFTYGPQPPPPTAKSAVKAPHRRIHTATNPDPGWLGHAEFAPLTLHIEDLDQPIEIPHLIVYAGQQPPASQPHTRTRRAPHTPKTSTTKPGTSQPTFQLAIAPTQVPLGAATPLTLAGVLNASGFQLQFTGPAAVPDLAAIHHQLGAFPLQLDRYASRGLANLNLTLAGPWIAPFSEFATQPSVTATGSVQLTGITMHPGFLSGPATISKANLTLTPLSITWNSADFQVGALSGTFSASYTTLCQSADCPSRFTLTLPKAQAQQLVAAFTGSDAHGALWADLLAHIDEGHRNWPTASGAVSIGELSAGTLLLHKVLANVTVSGTNLKIDSLDSAALGGKLHAQGSLFAGGDSPAWHLDLAGSSIAIPRLAALFKEKWAASGVADIQSSFAMNGWNPSDLAGSATGTFHFTWRHGSLGNTAPFNSFTSWNAHGALSSNQLTIAGSTLVNKGSKTPTSITGAIGFDRTLNLNLASPTLTATLTGTLTHPKLTAATNPTSTKPAPKNASSGSS